LTLVSPRDIFFSSSCVVLKAFLRIGMRRSERGVPPFEDARFIYMKTHVRSEEIRFGKVKTLGNGCAFAQSRAGRHARVKLFFVRLCRIGIAHNGLVFSDNEKPNIYPGLAIVFVPRAGENWVWGLKEEYDKAARAIVAQDSPALKTAESDTEEQIGTEIIRELERGEGQKRIRQFYQRFPGWRNGQPPRVSAEIP
jgi:hypothetical protein